MCWMSVATQALGVGSLPNKGLPMCSDWIVAER
jgi:hypothetical protein